MNLDKIKKQTIISEYRLHVSDTSSSFVQISLLSSCINDLIEHLKIHKKDKHSRKGLIGLVNKRRKLLNYLKNNDYFKYLDLIKKLGIRK